LSLRNPQFLKAIGKLAATVRDEPLDVIIGEDVRQHRVFKLAAAATIILLSALLVAASGAAYYANEKRKEAIEAAERERVARQDESAARDQAEARRKEAEERRAEAETQRGIALVNEEKAHKQQEIAEQQRAHAQEQTNRAVRELSLRNWQQGMADRQSNDYIGAAHYLARAGQTSADPQLLQNSLLEVEHYMHGYSLVFQAQHHSAVKGVAFTKDRSLMLSWTKDEAGLWRVAESSPVGGPMRHDEDFGGPPVFSPDESTVLTYSVDGTIRLWNTRDGSFKMMHERGYYRYPAPVYGAVFSPDGNTILSWGYDGAVRLWNAADGTPAGPPMYHGEVETSRVDEEDKDEPKRDPERYQVRGASFIEGGRQILSWGSDGYVRLWDARSCTAAVPPMALGRNKIDDREYPAAVTGVVYAPNKHLILAWGFINVAHVWRAQDGAHLFSMKHDDSNAQLESFLNVRYSAFSPDEERVLTVGEDGMAKLWNVADGSEIGAPIPAGTRDNAQAVFSEDGRTFITGAIGLSIWRSADGGLIASEFEKTFLSGEAVSADGHKMLGWQKDGTINLVRFSSKGFTRDSCCSLTKLDHGAALKMATSGVVDKAVRGAVLSQDGNYVLSWTARTARLWDASSWTGTPLTPVLNHESAIAGAALVEDGRRIVTWTEGGRVRIWAVNLEDRFEASLSGVPSPADEPLYATGVKDDTASQWLSAWVEVKSEILRALPDGVSLTLGQLLKRYGDKLLPYAEGQKRIGDVSADERLVIVWDKSGASLLRTADGELVRRLVQCRYSEGGAEFSDDGSMILTWCTGKGVQLEHTDGANSPIQLKDPGVTLAVLSRNKEYVLTMDEKHDVYLWSGRNGVWALHALTYERRRATHAVGFSPDSQLALTTDGGLFYLWRARDAALVGQPFSGYGRKYKNEPAFSHDGKFVLTAKEFPIGELGPLSYELWNAKDGTLAHDLEPNDGVEVGWSPIRNVLPTSGVAFSKSGALLLVWFGDTAWLWLTADGRQAFPAIKQSGNITEALFSEDERLLFIGSGPENRTSATSIYHTFDGSPAVESITGSLINGRNLGRNQRFLVSDGGGKIYLWRLGGKRDLAQEDLPLYVEVKTGTTLDQRGSVTFLSSQEWLRKRGELTSKVGASVSLW
jgi:WD40 repeat protein